MEEMEKLKVQLERLSDFVKEEQLVVAELGEKLQKRWRKHAELPVLQGALSRQDARFTNLEQRGE